jgi:uncharacterized protein
MMEAMVEVSDVPDENRFVVKVDGAVAGFLRYRLQGDQFVAVHTEIDPAFSGQGLGGTLVTNVLDNVRDTGLRLLPLCPFVKGFLEKHPEYNDLVVRNGGAS